MTEDINTKDLSDSEKLDLILARLHLLEMRFDGRDTNPLLPPNFNELFQTLVADVRDVRLELHVMREDLDRERKNRVDLAQRLATLEKQAA